MRRGVRVGQIWKRVREGATVARYRVVSVDGGTAVCEPIDLDGDPVARPGLHVPLRVMLPDSYDVVPEEG